MKTLSLLALLTTVTFSHAEYFDSSDIYMIDGDTAKAAGQKFRLTGFDSPETYRPKCDFERALGEQATRRARQLVRDAGRVNLVVSPGKDKYGRGLAQLYVQGQNIGDILIAQRLARPYSGGRRQSWCQ